MKEEEEEMTGVLRGRGEDERGLSKL